MNLPLNNTFLRQRFLPALALLSILGSLAFLYAPALSRHLHSAQQLNRFQDDMLQQVVPYLKYHDPQLMQDYLAGDYFIACMPLGFHALYRGLAPVINPIDIATTLPYILYAIFLLGMGLAAKRLAGWTGLFLALAFCLSADVYLDRMTGGLARAFGFPIVALGLAALVCGRIKLLMAVIVAGAAFYPSAAVPLGMALAITLLFLPANDRGVAEDWSLKKRILLLALTGISAAALILPTALKISPYGPSITPKDLVEFPEADEGGRYEAAERAPFPPFFQSASQGASHFLFTTGNLMADREGYTGQAFHPQLRAWAFTKNYKGELKRKNRLLPLLYLISVIGLVGLALRQKTSRPLLRRLLSFALSFFAAYHIACFAAPYFYLPERYIVFPIPPFMTLFLCAGLYGLAQLLPQKFPRALIPLVLILPGLLFLLTFGGRGNDSAGLYRRLYPHEKPIVAAAGELPPSSHIAGWPNGVINYLPLFAERKPFLTFEIHQAFHQAYTLEMRKRMHALLEATYATELKPIYFLRDTWAVDYLILDIRNFSRRPNYFNPFGEPMSELFKSKGAEAGKFWDKLKPQSLVFENGPYLLIDLKSL